MLIDIKGKEVSIFLELSVWGNAVVSGKVLDVSDEWVKVQCKKSMELIAVSAIKKVSYKL
ncbi:protein of unknown function [Shewanella benthica]|uniref:Uncharacterized protein n=1 Tax=Shewanella benthica TaxID=43661 RepID=A0A330M5R8_9GAMM|nr:hypothetical protein [Shewanella benthica]SQH77846.1 protein of unknown function [Shewanella benthica]